MQLTISSYLFGFAAGQIFYGPVSDRLGRRPVLLAALVLYAVATIGCAAAQSIGGLISACQRLMPLGQETASKIRWNLKPVILRAATSREMTCFTALPEIASMRHGGIETRLFIS